MIKEKICGSYLSSNKMTDVKYCLYIPEKNPSAVIQISHDMCECIESYENGGFVSAMTEAGFVICGNDHIGHGKTSADDNALGHFDDCNNLTEDLHLMNMRVKKRYPNLPYILLGQGVGALAAMDYIVKYNDIDGAVLCGMIAGNQTIWTAKALVSLIVKLKGGCFRSPFLHKFDYRNRNKSFSSEKDEYSWLSSDVLVRNRYRVSKPCTVGLTAAAYREILRLYASVSTPETVSHVPLSLPIYLMSGEDDPFSENGEGIKQLYSALEELELNELKMKLYAGARHDIFNDICRNEATDDLIMWINEVAEGVVACRSYNSIPFGRVDF